MLCGSSWSAAAVAAEAPQQRMSWSGGEAAAAAVPGGTGGTGDSGNTNCSQRMVLQVLKSVGL
jgi:hypothetical protein